MNLNMFLQQQECWNEQVELDENLPIQYICIYI